jgi:hypothetical protein
LELSDGEWASDGGFYSGRFWGFGVVRKNCDKNFRHLRWILLFSLVSYRGGFGMDLGYFGWSEGI